MSTPLDYVRNPEIMGKIEHFDQIREDTWKHFEKVPNAWSFWMTVADKHGPDRIPIYKLQTFNSRWIELSDENLKAAFKIMSHKRKISGDSMRDCIVPYLLSEGCQNRRTRSCTKPITAVEEKKEEQSKEEEKEDEKSPEISRRKKQHQQKKKYQRSTTIVIDGCDDDYVPPQQELLKKNNINSNNNNNNSKKMKKSHKKIKEEDSSVPIIISQTVILDRQEELEEEYSAPTIIIEEQENNSEYAQHRETNNNDHSNNEHNNNHSNNDDDNDENLIKRIQELESRIMEVEGERDEAMFLSDYLEDSLVQLRIESSARIKELEAQLALSVQSLQTTIHMHTSAISPSRQNDHSNSITSLSPMSTPVFMPQNISMTPTSADSIRFCVAEPKRLSFELATSPSTSPLTISRN